MDWGTYKDEYNNLSLGQHRAVYDAAASKGKSQRRFHVRSAHTFLQASDPVRVVELGGWDGELAFTLMPHHPTIITWLNYELAQVAVTDPLPTTVAYQPHVLTDQWAWEHEGFTGDTFISSHSIEHISNQQFGQLLAALDAGDFKNAFIQAPIPADTIPDWARWNSGHVLQMSMTDIDTAMAKHGWDLSQVDYVGRDTIRGWHR